MFPHDYEKIKKYLPYEIKIKKFNKNNEKEIFKMIDFSFNFVFLLSAKENIFQDSKFILMKNKTISFSNIGEINFNSIQIKITHRYKNRKYMKETILSEFSTALFDFYGFMECKTNIENYYLPLYKKPYCFEKISLHLEYKNNYEDIEKILLMRNSKNLKKTKSFINFNPENIYIKYTFRKDFISLSRLLKHSASKEKFSSLDRKTKLFFIFHKWKTRPW